MTRLTPAAAGRLLLPLALLIPACAPPPPATSASDEPKPVPVTLGEAKPLPLRRTVPVTGTLYPFEDVTLAPKVSGRVLRTYKDVGDRVGPGEPLLQLDDAEFLLAVEQAQPAFDAELRKLKLTALPDSDAAFEKHLPAVDAVNEARANMKFAEAEMERTHQEIKGGVGSRQALDTAVNRVAVAAARVQLAETDARVTLTTARRLKAALDDAKRKLADTCLKAPDQRKEWAAELGKTDPPLEYAVASKMVSAGEMVQSMPVTNCFRLVIDHALKLGVAVPEKFAPDVVRGQKVEIRVNAYPDRVFTGTVERISPTTDTGNRTFGVVIVVRNGDGKLKAGGFATADIIVREDSVVTVPPDALVQFAGVNKVFAADGDKARSVEVTVGTRDKQWVEVGGLPAGTRVITSGQSQLVDGSPIRIR